jgi:hypothetical protein
MHKYLMISRTIKWMLGHIDVAGTILGISLDCGTVLGISLDCVVFLGCLCVMIMPCRNLDHAICKFLCH